jgi:DNA-binding protein H-NS
MTTLQELIAQKDALLRQQQEIAKSIAEFQSAQRAGVINEIKTLMAQHGITVTDLATTGRKASNPEKEPSKVAAKYRDPATGSTWTGRGLKPRWLAAALESGRTQDEFLIEAQAS